MTMSRLFKAIYFYHHKVGAVVQVQNAAHKMKIIGCFSFDWLLVELYLILFSEKKNCYQTLRQMDESFALRQAKTGECLHCNKI